MNFGMMESGYNLPLVSFWNVENEKLERAFNFAKEELEAKIKGGTEKK